MKYIKIIFAITSMLFSQALWAQLAQPEGKTTLLPPAARVLVPYGSGTRLCWVNIGLTPYPYTLGIAAGALVQNYSSSTGAYTERILNPSAVAGLHTTFSGWELTGVIGGTPTCLYGSGTLYDNVMLSITATPSGTTTPKHFLLCAKKNAGPYDYYVTNAIAITSAFAPATGWTMSHITVSVSGSYYCLFNKNSGSGTYLAQINPCAGTSSVVAYWPTECFDALTMGGGSTNFVMLDNASHSFKVYSTTTSTTTTYPQSFPASTGCGSWATSYTNFISEFSGYTFYSGSNIYHTSTLPSSMSNMFYTLLNMTSFAWAPSPYTGAVMPDADR